MGRFNSEQFSNALAVAAEAEYGVLSAGTHEVFVKGCSFTILESSYQGVEKKEPAIEFTFVDDSKKCSATLVQKFPVNDQQSQNFIAMLIQILSACGMSKDEASKMIETIDGKNETDEAFTNALNEAINKIPREQRVAYLLVRNVLYSMAKSIKYGVIVVSEFVNKKYSVVPFISKNRDVVMFNPAQHDVSEEQLSRQLARLSKPGTTPATEEPSKTTSDLPF